MRRARNSLLSCRVVACGVSTTAYPVLCRRDCPARVGRVCSVRLEGKQAGPAARPPSSYLACRLHGRFISAGPAAQPISAAVFLRCTQWARGEEEPRRIGTIDGAALFMHLTAGSPDGTARGRLLGMRRGKGLRGRPAQRVQAMVRGFNLLLFALAGFQVQAQRVQAMVRGFNPAACSCGAAGALSAAPDQPFAG